MLLKQQKPNTGDSFDLSSLTLEEPASPVEEVVTNISSTKVNLFFPPAVLPQHYIFYFPHLFLVLPLVTNMLPFFLFFQPVLQYSSAFDDEVEKVPEGATAQLPKLPEEILESVQEEPPEAVIDADLQPLSDEESPPCQPEPGRASSSVVHGPFYYFYQGQ